MEYEDRWYQIEAEDALLRDISKSVGVHPVVAIPTAGGKTKILSSFIYKYLERFPLHHVLVLSHTKRILRQDHEAITSFFPGIRIGLYSAGLKSRTIEKITVGGIQSVYRNTDAFRKFGLIIVDEAHTVPTKGMGMYRTLFSSLDWAKRVGLTATHFRMRHGYIHKGEGALFNTLSYDLCSMDNFNRLTEEGYLCKLFSKATDLKLNVDGVKTTASDYNLKDLASRVNREEITTSAVGEVVELAKGNYHHWLIFAIDIAHCDHINEKLHEHGIKSKVLHSRMKENDEDVILEFKNGDIECIVSVGMVTTGFDAPNIDLIILLRPTKSPVLHIQMIGRGLRVLPDKEHCLIMDFAGNIMRLGPINDVQIPKKRKKKGDGEGMMAKQCPDCSCLSHISVKVCEACGHIFKFKQKITTKADRKNDVVAGGQAHWADVKRVSYAIHNKPGKPSSLKVTYNLGLTNIVEYVCLDHGGYAGYKAKHWVDRRISNPTKDMNPIKDIPSLFAYSRFLKKPEKILIAKVSKYVQIKDAVF